MENINVYSKSDHPLGRLLSNFAHTPFEANGHRFESVEAWWYWYCTGKKYHHLKQYYGFKAKQEGRKYPKVFKVTPEILLQVYRIKLDQNQSIKEALLGYPGGFDHYYIYGEKKVYAPEYLWTVKLWETLRNELLSEQER